MTESLAHSAQSLSDIQEASELLSRAHALAGRTLGEVAIGLNLPLPAAPTRD
jgi:DNA mismatch repair protein MutH